MIDKIETLGEFKKNLKNFIKSSVRTKFFEDDSKMNNIVITYKTTFSKKEKEGRVKFKIETTFYETEFKAIISTRIYNKINDELFNPIIEQLVKAKNIESISFKLVPNEEQ